MTNLYSVLGLAKSADQTAVKAAYRRLAKASHPDLHAGKYAAERIREVNLAYETLGDREARAAYDADWAAERARKRRELRSAVATMSATFVLTVFWGVFTAVWLLA